jgi:hypothetical protein
VIIKILLHTGDSYSVNESQIMVLRSFGLVYYDKDMEVIRTCPGVSVRGLATILGIVGINRDYTV